MKENSLEKRNQCLYLWAGDLSANNSFIGRALSKLACGAFETCFWNGEEMKVY